MSLLWSRGSEPYLQRVFELAEAVVMEISTGTFWIVNKNSRKFSSFWVEYEEREYGKAQFLRTDSFETSKGKWVFLLALPFSWKWNIIRGRSFPFFLEYLCRLCFYFILLIYLPFFFFFFTLSRLDYAFWTLTTTIFCAQFLIPTQRGDPFLLVLHECGWLG